MASHPYISGGGNITQLVGLLRKNFPVAVTSDTIKKYGLAPKNESYLINSLQFIGAINEEGKKTERAAKVFTIHDEEEFQAAFEGLIREAYSDLFDLHGDGVWALDKGKLINYFRTTDQTSDVIGSRQTGVFRAFAELCGHQEGATSTRAKGSAKPKEKAARPLIDMKRQKGMNVAGTDAVKTQNSEAKTTIAARDMALIVRIEINLPAEGTRETYDNIFRSIRYNLLND